MTDFETLKQAAYHRVACGPFEQPTRELSLSDIVLHLPVLEYYASKCDHVTEFGVRDGQSTLALIAGCKGDVRSYDIAWSPIVETLYTMSLPCLWKFRQIDTGSSYHASVVGETDFLFVDTAHVYDHVRRELALHGRKARKFIGFHDTYTCELNDISGPDPKAEGIGRAIREFLDEHGDYREVFKTNVCNGLLVVERVY